MMQGIPLKSKIKAGTTGVTHGESGQLSPTFVELPPPATTMPPLFVPVWWLQKKLKMLIESLQQLLARMQKNKEAAAPNAESIPRYLELDLTRGVAVIMMIAFHFILTIASISGTTFTVALKLWWLLRYLISATFITVLSSVPVYKWVQEQKASAAHHAETPFFSPAFGQILTMFIVALIMINPVYGVGATLFIWVVGVSLMISFARYQEQKKKSPPVAKYLQRGGILLAIGALVSFVSYLMIPAHFTPFGVISFIGLSIILSYPFLHLPALVNFGAGVAITATKLGKTSLDKWKSGSALLDLFTGATAPSWSTVDYFPLIPWFGFVLLGIYVAKVTYLAPKEETDAVLQLPKTPLTETVSWIGRQALPLYLLHLPLFYLGLRPLVLAGNFDKTIATALVSGRFI